ncbi:hypothetical protein [Lysinibacter cavernae]|uniref:Uncharacterized protein n=1 Tax=Lysinibacter cavernae TaxID=1640652 RepID=A0A7X5TTT9_9MICO|nr:hypothetical protein [Lysinibacter cavernae]NIH54550.1 hypothetical protein [Lysinibacter cavernae]
MIRLILSAAVGVFLASLLALLISQDDSWTWVRLTSGIIVITLFIIVRLATSAVKDGTFMAVLNRQPLSAEQLAEADNENRLAVARVLSISRTGSAINDQPVCSIEVLVAHRFIRPYRTSLKQIIDIVELPRVQLGSVVLVALERRDASPVRIVTTPPFSWLRELETNTAVRSLPDAPALTEEQIAGDGLTSATTASSSTRKQAKPTGLRRIPAFCYVIAIIAGFGLTLIPAYPTIAALLDGSTTIDEIRASYEENGPNVGSSPTAKPVDFFTGTNAQDALNAIMAASGNNQMMQLNIYSTFAGAEVLVTPGDSKVDDYIYRDGTATNDGPTLIQPDAEDAAEKAFDPATLDLTILPSLLAQAKELTGITEFKEGQTPSMHIMKLGGVLSISVPLYADYYDAWVTFAPDGSVLSMRGGIPGSASYEAGQG